MPRIPVDTGNTEQPFHVAPMRRASRSRMRSPRATPAPTVRARAHVCLLGWGDYTCANIGVCKRVLGEVGLAVQNAPLHVCVRMCTLRFVARECVLACVRVSRACTAHALFDSGQAVGIPPPPALVSTTVAARAPLAPRSARCSATRSGKPSRSPPLLYDRRRSCRFGCPHGVSVGLFVVPFARSECGGKVRPHGGDQPH